MDELEQIRDGMRSTQQKIAASKPGSLERKQLGQYLWALQQRMGDLKRAAKRARKIGLVVHGHEVVGAQ
jgi:hypothetical protein